jgi:hypothetical protein
MLVFRVVLLRVDLKSDGWRLARGCVRIACSPELDVFQHLQSDGVCNFRGSLSILAGKLYLKDRFGYGDSVYKNEW